MIVRPLNETGRKGFRIRIGKWPRTIFNFKFFYYFKKPGLFHAEAEIYPKRFKSDGVELEEDRYKKFIRIRIGLGGKK